MKTAKVKNVHDTINVKNIHMLFSFCFDTELMICGGVDFSLYH